MAIQKCIGKPIEGTSERPQRTGQYREEVWFFRFFDQQDGEENIQPLLHLQVSGKKMQEAAARSLKF